MSEPTREKTKTDKVVVQVNGRIIKGYIESTQWESLEGLLVQGTRSMPDTVHITPADGSEPVDFAIADAKAIFFVKSFEGRCARHDLKFFSHAPMVHGVWVQLRFQDGEIMEGVVMNGLPHLVQPGFFLHPTDPDGNNSLVYVLKSSLTDYRVLGVRSL
jgi:hypothetical protein